MAKRINTAKLQNKVTKLHKERSAAFYGPDRAYTIINNRLNSARKALQRAYNWNHKVQDMEFLPVAPGCSTYTRIESTDPEVAAKIDTWYHPINLSNVYVVDGMMARNLKDAVAYAKEI